MKLAVETAAFYLVYFFAATAQIDFTFSSRCFHFSLSSFSVFVGRHPPGGVFRLFRRISEDFGCIGADTTEIKQTFAQTLTKFVKLLRI